MSFCDPSLQRDDLGDAAESGGELFGTRTNVLKTEHIKPSADVGQSGDDVRER